MSQQSLLAKLKKSKRFLITTHTSPEGDALGSELAFYRLIRSWGKEAVIVNIDPTPPVYHFLPGQQRIRCFSRGMRRFPFDCVVVLDCSDMNRCGEVLALNTRGVPILNIDHHRSNDRFGTDNWVVPDASSCAEMVYTLYKKARVSIDEVTALLLYVGILTDTGSFRYSNTTPYTHEAAAELLRHGLNVAEIYRVIYQEIPLPDIKLFIRILPTMQRSERGRLAWFQFDERFLQRRQLSVDLTENILSFARSIKDVEVVVLFRERLAPHREVRVNMRSQGAVDVGRIAMHFGGGGHKTASGCTVKGALPSVKRVVIARIVKALRQAEG